MNMRKFFRVIITAVLTLLMVTIIVSSVSAFVFIPILGPFDDISIFHWAVRDITWLKSNDITTGYSDNTFRPDNNVTRAEMAAFLHREAGALVAAGIHVKRGGCNEPVIERWFNNINGSAPTVSGSGGHYNIDFQFPMDDKFLQCTIDNNYVVTRDAVCSVYIRSSGGIFVEIFDNSEGGPRPGEYWVLVYGNDIQP